MDYPLGKRLRELPGPLLLTGHTGFKGTWLTFLLEQLNVPVVGYSLPAEKDSLFDRAERTGAIPEEFSDIREFGALEQFIDLHKPSTIVHMAAQPLVLKSYEEPRETFDVNVMGTVNVLEIAFKKDYVKAVIIVTTDKVYKNDNSGRAFIEGDPLEGKDPYSASKVAAEASVAAWFQLAKNKKNLRIVSVRAGNVIGGGDFSDNRIVPDIVRGFINKQTVNIRNPKNTRPWQHVLDPLVGYIMALEKVLDSKLPQSFNFGPNDQSLTTEELVVIASSVIEFDYDLNYSAQNIEIESKTLDLDSSLAKKLLSWEPKFSQTEAIIRTFNWWEQVISKKISAKEACKADIEKVIGRKS